MFLILLKLLLLLFFLGLYLWYLEDPGLGVESGLLLLATATQAPSHI